MLRKVATRPRRDDQIEDLLEHAIDPRLSHLAPDVITAALRPFVSDTRAAKLEAALASRLTSLAIVLEDLWDPHNGAAVLRSVEANGLQRVLTIEPKGRFKVSRRVSLGTDKWLDVTRTRDIESCARALEHAGFTLAAAVPGAPLLLEQLPVDRPIALVFGNEHLGLSEAALAKCGLRYGIPMAGMAESFNLSVSVAISVYVTAQRMRAHLGRAGDLDDAAKAKLRARWYSQDVRGAVEIVKRQMGSGFSAA